MANSRATLRTANLNLIPVLRALLKETNVSRAAESLNLSQSATSGALARLRLLLDDPILVQVGRSMLLTPRAKQLLIPLEQLCGSLEELLQSAPFDPKAAERRFVIATPDYIGLLIGNALIETLHEAAPGVSVFFVDVPSHLPEQLTAGAADIAIVALNRPAWEGMSSQGLFSDRSVGLVSRTHPLASKLRPSLADFAIYPNIRYLAGSDRPPPQFASPEQDRATQFLAQQFTILPLLALSSQCVAAVPKMLADFMMDILPLAIIELPYSLAPIEGGLLWSPVQDADPAHRWFRTLLAQILTRTTEGQSVEGLA